MKKFFCSIFALAATFFISTAVYSHYSESKKNYTSLAVELSSGRVFAVNEGHDGIDVIDSTTGKVTKTLLRHNDVEAIALNEQKNILLAAGDRKLHIISTETFAEQAGIRLRKHPVSISVSSDPALAVVTHEEDHVSFIDLNSNAIIKELKIDKKPISAAIDPGLHMAVIVHKRDDKDDRDRGRDWDDRDRDDRSHHHHRDRTNVTIVDLKTFAVVNELTTGKAAKHVSINSTTHQAVITNEKSNDLTIIDLVTQTIAGTIPVQEHPVSSSFNECLNTLSVIGGKHASWLQVVSMQTGTSKSYSYNQKLKDVAVHPYLNKAFMAGNNGLTVVNLPNPVPVLSSLSPATAQRGAPAFELEIKGEGLLQNTAIYLNNNTATTSYPGCGTLKAKVPDSYLVNESQIAVRATNPTPDGGNSNVLYLSIVNPVPAISALQPNLASAGTGTLPVDIIGMGFFPDTTVSVNNAARAFTYVSENRLQLTLTPEDLATGGVLSIIASNPAPGGGISLPANFTVQNPVPTMISVSPTSIKAGGDASLTITGSNFVKNSQVLFNTQPVATIFTTNTSLQATIPAALLKNAGTGSVQVSNPVPVGGQTGTLYVTITPQSNPNVQPLPEGSFGKKYQNLIPMDATIQSYDPKRFAIVTGLVQDRNQAPVAGVAVSFLGLSQYGTAQTDASGRYSLPVDGGGVVTVIYQKQGYITSHRQANTPWNDIINTDTVTLLTEDTKATTITFDGNPNTVLTHTSTPITDSRGTRSLTMVFTGDNKATITDANGQQVVRTTITTRATEFDTPASMPAKLPPTSAFTYCSELSVDGATNVKFDKPVTMYVDNFLGFKVGEVVPVGYYDRARGVWVGSDNGVVVKLLDTNGDGIVDALDTVGDGLPHDRNVVGLTDPMKFKPGSTYWRVKLDHFTPWDCNWPYGPPMDAILPNPDGNPDADQQPQKDDCDKNASYCERRSRIVHEDVPIPGTTMTLHYASNRVQGYKTIVSIPASGASVPASLTRIIVRMEVAGRIYQTVLPPAPHQKAEFIWDGLDYLGVPAIGPSIANISVGFGYVPAYYSAGTDVSMAWERVGNRNNATGIGSREEILLWKYKSLVLRGQKAAPLIADQFGDGWALSTYNNMFSSDPNTLYKGDGINIDNNIIISTVAGNGQAFSGDGGPATQAGLGSAGSVAVDSSGNIYIAGSNRIRKVDASGMITTVAGNGVSGFSGDGGPATQAGLTAVAVAVDRVGNIYMADNNNSRIRKVDTSGIITTVAGNGQIGFSGDNGPATLAVFQAVAGVAVDNVGNIYIADSGNSRIRKVDTSGIITTIAGNGQAGFSGDGGPATQAKLYEPEGVRVDSAGNIYIAEWYTNRIRKVDTSGIITTIAGNGHAGFSGDGGLATQASLYSPADVTVDNVGNIYIADSGNNRIRRVDNSGIITTVAGTANGYWGSFSGDGGPATQAGLSSPVSVALDGAGDIYIAESRNIRIRKVGSGRAFASQVAQGDVFFADTNGLGYIISRSGLHKSTIDLATGKTLLSFGYDTNNQLISVSDRFGNQTTIQRSGNGTPVSITAPDGQVTSLVVDGNNHLTQVAYQDGTHYAFDYTNDGLLTYEYDRRNNRFVHNYDANGRITSVSDPEGGNWNYSRITDNAGNITASVQTGEGNTITYRDRTDSTGAYTSVKTEPTGEVTTINRTSDELTETIGSSCGMNQSLKYDLDSQYKFKYLTGSTTTSPSGLKLTAAFLKTYQDTNADTQPDMITDIMSRNTRTWTTINNNQTGTITSTSPAGRTITSSYDPTTLLTQQISVPGLLPTQFGYDNRGRLVSSVTGSRTTTISYDTNGYPNKLVTPDNKTYNYTNDVMGKLVAVQNPDGSTINYNYDQNGNLTVLTNPLTISNGFGYTANNQRKSWTTPISGSYQYTYDKERKLKTITFPSGKVITNTYSKGLLTSTATPEGITNYAYSCGSNLGSATRGSESIGYTYDGTLLKTDTRTGMLNQALSYVYNNDFKISSMTYAGGTQTLGYDNDGLLTTAGAFTIIRNAQNGLPERVGDNTLLLARVFSNYGEMNQNTYGVGGNVLYQWNLTRDLAGRITRRTETMQGTNIVWDYAYDQLGRLKEVKKDDAVVESYGYDANGNRTSEDNVLRGINGKAYTYSNEDSVLTAGTDTYAFDKDGFLTSKAGSNGTTTFHYSSRGELLSATLFNGTEISYDHDPMGRRIAKRINGTITEKYLWLGQIKLLAILDAHDTVVMRFNYADGRMPASMTKEGATYYLFYDQIGSLRAVSDASGNIVKQIDYDAFGNIINDSAPTFAVPFGFAGGLHDRDTGLVRFGYRDYDPAIAKWTAKDPIDFRGGINLYAYTLSDPVNWIDSLGLYPGQMPPAPPGYNPATWQAGQWDSGNWFVRSPEGRLYTTHAEDEGHWRHWDIQGGDGDDKWPPNPGKRKPGQKKLGPKQCEADPSGDAPEWTPPTNNNPFMPFMPFSPIGLPQGVPQTVPLRIPIPAW